MKNLVCLLCVASVVLVNCSNDDKHPFEVESMPPAAISDLVLAKLPGRQVRLLWTAPGDDGTWGQASVYDIRYGPSSLTEQNWDSAAAIPSPPIPASVGEEQRLLLELPDGTWHLGIKTGDEVPNWSAISNQVSCEIGDKVPPAAVETLFASFITTHSVTLTWVAPGNDGTRGRASVYDLRQSLDPITELSWAQATRISGLAIPGEPGRNESFTVDGLLEDTTYHFALKTADDVPNWSALSNVASAFTEDLVAPNPVGDLSATSPSPDRITLRWMAPGDDGAIGQAATYELRYALTPLDEAGWAGAVPIQGLPSPAPAGTVEEFEVTGLESGRMYFIALKTADDVPNWSQLSNVATASPGVNSLLRLTYSNSRFGASWPDWSPDGQWVAFEADWEPGEVPIEQLYIIPAGGGAATHLTNLPRGCAVPSWSPDGSRLAFKALREDLPYTLSEVAVMNASPGSAPTVLVPGVATISVSKPVWSPDGERIAYTSETWDFPNPMNSEIRVVPSDGGASELLMAGGDWSFLGLDWSPDGTRIVYSSMQSGNFDIWVVPAAGGVPIQLTNDPGLDANPAWAPDGNRIVFLSDRSGNSDLWLMDATGENPTPLNVIATGNVYGPSWSPDGSAIAFASRQADKSEIWVIRLE